MLVEKSPELAGREVKAIHLTLQYRDQQGKVCGSDRIVLDVSHERDSVTLTTLGQDGSPFRATATLQAITVREREVTVPVN